MVGRGDGDGVDGLVVQQLADVGEGLGLGHAHVLHLPKALVQNILIHVADSDDGRRLYFAVLLDMGKSLPVQPDDRHLHAVVGAQDALRMSDERDATPGKQADTCLGTCLQEFPAVYLRFFRHGSSSSFF